MLSFETCLASGLVEALRVREVLILRRAIYIISLLGAGRFNAILIIVLDVAFEEAVLPLEGIPRTCVG